MDQTLMPTIVISSIIAIIVLAVIIKGIYNRKNGKSSCGCNCSGCAMKDKCHPNK